MTEYEEDNFSFPSGANDPRYGPCWINCININDMYSFHPGGVNALFGDGSVRFVSEKTSIRVIGALITPNNGEPFNWSEL